MRPTGTAFSWIFMIAVACAAPMPSIAADGCCEAGGCNVCKPKWEDKKTKKPKYTQKCSDECVRGVDSWCDHGCCAEETPPSAGIFTRKKLYKQEEDKTQRILKYELAKGCTTPCNLPPCRKGGPPWYDVYGHICRCLGL